jgi:hypothetical protein
MVAALISDCKYIGFFEKKKHCKGKNYFTQNSCTNAVLSREDLVI